MVQASQALPAAPSFAQGGAFVESRPALQWPRAAAGNAEGSRLPPSLLGFSEDASRDVASATLVAASAAAASASSGAAGARPAAAPGSLLEVSASAAAAPAPWTDRAVSGVASADNDDEEDLRG
uniref:Uncharacterized protein n=1 Tax=Spumella elongata TaxID=89044 RepID=A0A7S3HFA6_9STRA